MARLTFPGGTAPSPEEITQLFQQSPDAEVICLVRPKNGSAGRVVIVNQASTRFVSYLLDSMDGPHGAAVSDGRSSWEVDVPRIRAVDAIGSGDAFTAGLIVALDAGRSTEEALAFAAAAGTANAETFGAGRLDGARQAELVGQVRVRRLSR